LFFHTSITLLQVAIFDIINPIALSQQHKNSCIIEVAMTALPAFATIRLTFSLVRTVAVVYLWLHTPLLTPYSFQGFALAVSAFFIIKRLKNAKLWHLMPKSASAEIALITFAFLILIGATGNFYSPFYPLAHIHLFVLAMTVPTLTAITVMLAVMLFHYGLSPELLPGVINELISLPLMLLFFLFAKKQYDEAKAERQIINQEEKEIAQLQQEESVLLSFISDFIKPKLQILRQTIQLEPDNHQVIDSQISLLETEIEKTLEKPPKRQGGEDFA
jgi:hypothetical protein